MRHRELCAGSNFRASELSTVWAWHARRQDLDTPLALHRTSTAGMRVLQGSQSCMCCSSGIRTAVQLARAVCEAAMPCAVARLPTMRSRPEALTSHAKAAVCDKDGACAAGAGSGRQVQLVEQRVGLAGHAAGPGRADGAVLHAGRLQCQVHLRAAPGLLGIAATLSRRWLGCPQFLLLAFCCTPGRRPNLTLCVRRTRTARHQPEPSRPASWPGDVWVSTWLRARQRDYVPRLRCVAHARLIRLRCIGVPYVCWY